MIGYQLVSEAVVLRDFTEVEYKNDEHKDLVDIADCMYSNAFGVDKLYPKYQKIYHQYGQQFWDDVFYDIKALDSQVYNTSKAQELLTEYMELIKG